MGEGESQTSRTRANPEPKGKGDSSMLLTRNTGEGMYHAGPLVLCAW